MQQESIVEDCTPATTQVSMGDQRCRDRPTKHNLKIMHSEEGYACSRMISARQVHEKSYVPKQSLTVIRAHNFCY